MEATLILEKVLQEKHNLTNYKEGEDWYRFDIENCDFQVGIKNKGLHIIACLNEIDVDSDYEQLYKDIENLNNVSLIETMVKVKEANNYFKISNIIDLSFARENAIASCIEEILEISKNSEVQNLIRKSRMW